MSEKTWLRRLDHILDCIRAIEDFTRDCDQEKFLETEIIYTAVERKMQIIGEASKHVPDDVKSEYSDLN